MLDLLTIPFIEVARSQILIVGATLQQMISNNENRVADGHRRFVFPAAGISMATPWDAVCAVLGLGALIAALANVA